MIIQHNLSAMNANRKFGLIQSKSKKNTEKLSSGYRINRSADDAAGLAISEKMRRQIRGLTQASLNVAEGIGFVQTADGALDEIDDMLQRVNELAVKSANGTLTDGDREYIDSEVQNLKSEMDRIFETTTFNDRLIWDREAPDKKVIGYEKLQSLKTVTNSKYYDITDKNCGIVPKTNIKVSASEASGVSFSWTGYDGVTYQTGAISFADFEANGYSVKLSDLYNDPKFFEADGTTPLIDATYTVRPIAAATHKDIADTINNSGLYSSSSSPLSAQFEDGSGAAKSNSLLSVYSASLDYAAAYKSFISADPNKYDFDRGVDDCFVPTPATGNLIVHPSYTDVASAKTDSSSFKFSFNMAGIGPVTAELTNVSYSSSDGSPEAKGTWWYTYTNPTTHRTTNLTNTYNVSPTLAGLMDMLTGGYGDSTPGLLTEENGGCSKTGGSASLNFNIMNGGSNIGNIRFTLNVTASDTEESVLQRIKDGLNDNTVLDLYSTDSAEQSSQAGRIYTPTEPTHKIDSPLYQATNKFFVHSGSERDDEIWITYDALNTNYIGMENTNVLTVDDAKKAIDDVKNAMQIVNAQRADWGAYQNRLEHTVKNLDNVVENTTAAESRIRDTDMATEMVAYSTNNILLQAATSMMAQANQSNSTVLSLLS